MKTTSNFDHHQLYSKNLYYFAKIAPALADQVQAVAEEVKLERTTNNDFNLIVNNSLLLDNVFNSINASFRNQIETPDRIISERPTPSKPPQSITDLVTNIVDTEEYVVIEQLEGLPLSKIQKSQFSDVAKDIILFGSLSILYIDKILNSSIPSTSFLLVEKDPRYLCALLNLVDFEELVVSLKSLGIGFQIIFEPIHNDFGYRIQEYYGLKNPLAILGLRTFQAPSLPTELIEAHSWCHSADGLLSMAQGMLGNDTDEYNQIMHATYNMLKCNDARLITRDVLSADDRVVLVSSGPSLDSSLPLLKEIALQAIIVAAGSSIGTLLRSGIKPTIVVLLEMSSAVFEAVNSLVEEGYDLSDIILVASSTVDPRIPDLFRQVIFFHRPLSAAHAISPDLERNHVLPQAGPQAANAALEVVLEMGSRDILLFGCDFGAVNINNPRSTTAVGTSLRNLNMPVRGSHGRTIFSSDELSVTRNLFENSIRLYKPKVTSFGEGSWIDGVEHLPLDINADSLPVGKSSIVSSDIFYQSVKRPVLDSESLEGLIQSIHASFHSLPDEILSILKSNNAWTHQLSMKLSEFISWDDSNFHKSKIVVKRLTRFPLYFLFALYHDSSEILDDHTSESFMRSKRSLIQLSMLGSSLCAFLLELVGSESLPEWSPEMARSGLQRAVFEINKPH